jgi:hypothetical protein
MSKMSKMIKICKMCKTSEISKMVLNEKHNCIKMINTSITKSKILSVLKANTICNGCNGTQYQLLHWVE